MIKALEKNNLVTKIGSLGIENTKLEQFPFKKSFKNSKQLASFQPNFNLIAV